MYLHHGLKDEVGIYHLVTFELSEVTDVFELAALVLLCASVIVATHPYLALHYSSSLLKLGMCSNATAKAISIFTSATSITVMLLQQAQSRKSAKLTTK